MRSRNGLAGFSHRRFSTATTSFLKFLPTAMTGDFFHSLRLTFVQWFEDSSSPLAVPLPTSVPLAASPNTRPLILHFSHLFDRVLLISIYFHQAE
jgi:hypothetical protein